MSHPVSLGWAPLAQALTELYGLPSHCFREFAFWTVPGDSRVYMTVAGSAPAEDTAALLNTGWAILDAPLPEGAPTDALLRIVGADATRNVLDVDTALEAAFRAGERMNVASRGGAAVLIVRRGRHALGGVSSATGLPVP